MKEIKNERYCIANFSHLRGFINLYWIISNKSILIFWCSFLSYCLAIVLIMKTTYEGEMQLMKREKYPQRKVRLVGNIQRDMAISILQNAPLDSVKPLEFILREEVKIRKMDANACMWACQLKCISEQAYVNGRTYSAEVWHEHAKEMFLPETFQSPEHQSEIVKEGYRKYDTSPSGKRILVGSTTELTAKGFSIYLQQLEAYGAQLGVIYSANPNEAYS